MELPKLNCDEIGVYIGSGIGGLATTGEQQPVYAITFELYENGVSRALILDYGDFVLTGEMTSLEMKDTKPCP